MKNVKLSQYVHLKTCKEALTNEVVFNNFKNDSNYRVILEHTPLIFAEQYIELLFSEYKHYADLLDWDKLRENDKIGSPNIVNFPSLKKYIPYSDYSPSTIYYICRGIHIIDKMITEDCNILEIGGGYGGQCKLLIDMCRMLDVPVRSYGIIDLAYASRLQSKYLGMFGYDVEYFEFESIGNFDQFSKYDLLISIYALGEFTTDVQDYYVNNIIDRVKNHYIIWNTENIHPYYKTASIVDEYPKTGRFNKLIIKV